MKVGFSLHEAATVMDKDLLKSLNPQQREAATILEGPVLVLAGAGSGKTKVVTCRIVHLIESGVPASGILGLTFTNKAAEEMRERINKICRQQVLICTFHSLGVRVLRESISALGYHNDFIIYDEDDAEKLIKSCLIELDIKDKKIEPKVFKNLISKAKNALHKPEDVFSFSFEAKPEVENAFPSMYALYQKKLREYNAVDFDDLLLLTVQLWQEFPDLLKHYQNRWPFLLVDEYQDTNSTQYTMIQLLVEKSRNIFVVGDPDQSIYSWRGANVQNILNFERDFYGARVISLEQNYRSKMNILEAANSLISHNTGRYEKELWSELGPGEKIKLFMSEDDRGEADFVVNQAKDHHDNDQMPYKDMVIFFRTNAQSRIFEDYLVSYQIPYVIVGGISFYQRREIKDVLAFLRLVFSGADFISFARTINLPKRGFGETTIEKIRLGASEERMTILAYSESIVEGKPLQTNLKLSAKQKESLGEYLNVLRQLRQLTKNSIRDLVVGAIEQSGYLDYLKEDRATYEDRKENLDALITKALEWDETHPEGNLKDFLEELSLKSQLDEIEAPQDRLNLMTIHNGKGLEFSVTFVVGLEEDLFPHINSKGKLDALEEERRLCYVGMTRAKEYLYLSSSQSRYLWGQARMQKPSRFLGEIDPQYIEKFRRPRKGIPQLDYAFAKPKPFRPLPDHSGGKIAEAFQSGDTVFHKEFGIGQIQEAYDGSLGLTYKIFFTNSDSVKTLVAKYAFLSKL